MNDGSKKVEGLPISVSIHKDIKPHMDSGEARSAMNSFTRGKASASLSHHERTAINNNWDRANRAHAISKKLEAAGHAVHSIKHTPTHVTHVSYTHKNGKKQTIDVTNSGHQGPFNEETDLKKYAVRFRDKGGNHITHNVHANNEKQAENLARAKREDGQEWRHVKTTLHEAEGEIPTNSMGTGQHIAMFDPILRKSKKKLRAIIKRKELGR